MNRRLMWCWSSCLLLLATPTRASEVSVAVASNFAGPMQIIADAFAKKTGHHVTMVTGATGKLYAQIKNGAPFEVLLAADDTTPAKLEAEGLGVAGTRFSYAFGKLALYSSKAGYVDTAGAILGQGGFQHLAIANPKLAPYGAAAISVLRELHLLEMLRPKFVQGENIAQTLEFVVTGNAELGFVALSQILVSGKAREGSYWLVPEQLYPALRQDAVLLKKGEKNAAARALATYLRTESARRVIERHGYGLPPAPSGEHSEAPPHASK